MHTPAVTALNRLPRFALVVLGVALMIMVAWANLTMAAAQARSPVHDLPFGVFALRNGTTVAQDFAYNLLFLEGIRNRVVARPYRLPDQEQMMRRILPRSQHGMTHAYSPVALILAVPFLSLPAATAYLVYTIVCAAAVLFLYYFHLMPRMETRLQVYAFLACVLSVCAISTLATGQTALITTAWIGMTWCLLQRRARKSGLLKDMVIGALFWALCFKPSVAVIPFALLLGEKAWRPLAMTSLLLLATWVYAANFYGGWWTGLSDYFYLLNHYNNADFQPYLQRGFETAAQAQQDLFLFSLDRGVVLTVTALLIALRWTSRIAPSQLFQGMIWVFLLFSPYLLGSEIGILCLIVVEGTFFRSQQPAVIAAKLLLLAAVVDLRVGLNSPVEIGVYLKWLLFLWIVAEGSRRKLTVISASPSEFRGGVTAAAGSRPR